MEDKKKEVKVEKEKEVEIGFNVGMESIGEPIDIDTTLDMIYQVVDN